MVEAQNHTKVVSIDAFRTARPDRRDGISYRASNAAPLQPSPKSIEHRERMLQFLRTEAASRREARNEAREVQGRLLL